MNWLKKIDGYKTYAFTVLTAIFVVIEFLIKGDYSLIACWGLAHNASILAIVACVRHAIQKATPVKVTSIIIAFLILGGVAFADTPTVSISQTVQSINVPGTIAQLTPKAVNTGFFYNWKDKAIQPTYSYAPLGAMQFSWGAWDYVNVGYASPDVLIAGTGLVLNVTVIEKKWGITAPTQVQNVLNTMSIGLTPMVGLEEIGGRNRWTGGPSAYVKVSW